MPFLPAICLDSKCGTIFSSGVLLQGGTGNLFVGNTAGPCPKCGSDGRIPNGEYSVLGDKVFALVSDISDANILTGYGSFIRGQMQEGVSPARIRDSLNDKFPQLKSLSDLIPKTRSDAYAFIAVMLTLIGLAMDCSDRLRTKAPTAQIKQEVINQTFQNVYVRGDSVTIYVQSDNDIESKSR